MSGSPILHDLLPQELRPLTPLEEKLIAAAPSGRAASDFDPQQPIDLAQIGDDQVVRAELLTWLLVTPELQGKIYHKGVHLHGAKIQGALDLADAHLAYPLRLTQCVIEEQMILERGKFALLDFSGSQSGYIAADSIQVEHDLWMGDGFKAKGEVRLRGANVGGQLICNGGQFENPGGYALNGDRLTTGGSVFLRNGFKAKGGVILRGAYIGSQLDCSGGVFENSGGYALNGDALSTKSHVFLRGNFKAKGEVNLLGANIGGQLDCSEGEFENPGGDALNGDSLTTGGSVFLRNGFKAKGEVRLLGASIDGQMDCSGGEFENPGGDALSGDRLTTKGNVFLRNGFTARGAIRLLGSNIGGNLECDGGQLDNLGGDALFGDGLTTKGDVFLRNGFKARGAIRLLGSNIGGNLECDGGVFEYPEGGALFGDNMMTGGSIYLRDGFIAKGEVRFLGASIGGQLDCSGGEFDNPEGDALSVDVLTTKGSVFLRNGFKANGAVRLLGSEIGANLECDGGQFENPGGFALLGNSLTTKGNVFLSEGFTAKGEVRLHEASIGGQLNCSNGKFENPEGNAFMAEGLKVSGSLFWRQMKTRPVGGVDLINVELADLDDDPASWPEAGKLRIDGLTYGPFTSGVPTDAKSRLEWLSLRNPSDSSVQPYEQLIRVFRQTGLQDDARQIAIARQQALHRKRKGFSRFGSWLLGATIDYGYRPQKVMLRYILPILALGILVFTWASSAGLMLPATDPPAPVFDPLAYSVDVFLPIVDLHQEDAWEPNTASASGLAVQYYLYFHILSGWLFTTLAVAAVTGLVRRE